MQRMCILLLLAGVISAQDSGCGTPRYMITDTGSFASHATWDGETTYDAFSDCHWNIDIPDTNLVVELQFSSMQIEAVANCPFDGLGVYDGVDDTAPVLATLCGHNTPYPIPATGPSMYCHFYSDFAVQGTGFLANYISRVAPVTCTPPTFLCGDDYAGYCAIQEERCDDKDQCNIDEEGCPGNDVMCGEPAIPPDTTWPVVNENIVTIKVVNGAEAVPHSWPWMTSLDSGGVQSCGASIYNNRWVITAAHCVNLAQDQIYMFNIRVGSHNLTDPAPTEVEHEIEDIIVHPDYNAITIDNDIALMKTRDTIVMNDAVSEVCLPLQGAMHTHGDEAWATGWGVSEQTSDIRALQQVMLPFVDNAICNTIHEDEITDNMLCAGYVEGGYDTCSGDSGGPLVWQDPVTQKWILYGLTSWGYGCAESVSPGVYTKVSNYVDWVDQMVYQNP